MTRMISTKTTFTQGELAPELLGRSDLAAYENGAATLRNVFIQPTGGVTRRAGLRHVDALAGAARLVPFEFNTEQVYLLAFTDQLCTVYMDDAAVTSFATPWTAAQLAEIHWTQSADTLLVAHRDVAPRRISRSAHHAWSIDPWAFTKVGVRVMVPMYRFAPEDVTLTPSDVTGGITITASQPVFDSGHFGTFVDIQGKQVEVTAVNSATELLGLVSETLDGTAATTDWAEQAFSGARGWPVSLTFHQDRLVIGGSRDLPNRLWLSKSADLFNFDLGEGLDDEAIEVSLLADQVNAVRAVFPGRHLQVFTSGAEWMVTGQPLTPANLQVRRQTRVGSPGDRHVPPREVDGATLFVSASGRELREFLFADVEQAYQATDLALLSRHLVDAPRDMDYDADTRLLHLVMADGTLATVTNYRAERVTAWTRQETDGAITAVAVAGGTVYLVVDRAQGWMLECFDDGLHMDAALTGTQADPATVWSGLDHLEGRTVQVVGDGARRPDAVVAGGQITLDDPASEMAAGLAFTHEIAPLPPAPRTARGGGHGILTRLIKASFRLLSTGALSVDVGRGPAALPLQRLPADVLDSPPPDFTGDVSVRAIGWHRDPLTPVWRVRQDDPVPCTLLSVSTEMKVTD